LNNKRDKAFSFQNGNNNQLRKYDNNAKSDHSNAVKKINDNPMYFRTSLNGCQADILLDTGSTKSFISADFVKTAKCQQIETDIFSITLADNSERQINSKVKASFQTLKGEILKTVELYTFSTSNYDIILGSDFLENNGIIIDFERKLAVIENEIINSDNGMTGKRHYQLKPLQRHLITLLIIIDLKLIIQSQLMALHFQFLLMRKK
ncbi:hypothetical protein M153_16000014164, partial [Pseudoloma neurophilia]